MDRTLRRELAAIARDSRSGAAELALRAVRSLQGWLRRQPTPSEQELLEIARVLLRAQRSMGPLLRLGNEVALAVDTKNPARTLAAALTRFRSVLTNGPRRIADQFWRALRRGPRQSIITYSYSSTVLQALVRARSRIFYVWCSEGRPSYEGRTTVSKLACAGIQTAQGTEAAQFSLSWFGDLLVLGADMVLEDAFVNKIGTDVLVASVRRYQIPVWLLVDTLKFWPERWSPLPKGNHGVASEVPRFAGTRHGLGSEVWTEAPRNVWMINPYFWFTPLFSDLRVLTEWGWMTPEQVRRELEKIRLSPRLAALAD